MLLLAKDEALYAAVSGAPPTTIAEVIAAMQAIDMVLPDDDGLKWFNRLYLTVTEQVDFHPPAGGWHDAAWLPALDVVFAGLYLRAVANSLDGSAPVPSAWAALFESRHRTGVDRIQFALAGMNAHINHDLALALLATDAQLGVVSEKGSAQYADYEAVNGLLNTVMPRTLTLLAVDCLGELAQDSGRVGQLLAFWDLAKARELAWDFAVHLRGLTGIVRMAALGAQDQMTGVVGRALLAFG